MHIERQRGKQRPETIITEGKLIKLCIAYATAAANDFTTD